jgi:N-acetyl sugar amidotransferase
MEFDADGVCMGCRMSEVKVVTPPNEWERRKKLLIDILENNRSRDGRRHDCVIGVSGGKDSYFQTHYIKNVLGFNPLLVTYYGNNYSEVGQRNLMRMKDVFGVDHLIYQPSVDLLKKLNRLGFMIMGDMNWHGHIGICTIPMKIAVQFQIPIVVWGEHGYADLCGQYSMNDFVEWSYRQRLEHYARGFEWNYMVGREGITTQDMFAYQYPSDEEIFRLGLRGIHLSNFVYWEANEHTKLMIEKYGFEVSDEAFDRTYRMASNLDDIHENGIHDYLKFIKFGYGRCTDHASKDIRAGILGRGQAVDLVRQYDHVKPRDLARWLDYTGMTEDEFDSIADTFRDPRVWSRDKGRWVKRNVWDAE